MAMEIEKKHKNMLDKLPEEIYKVFKQHGSEQLCFNQNTVLREDFQVDQFVSDCKRRVSLQALREDLEKHYKNIRIALIEIINHDYADFVNLSSNLVGVEKSLENLNGPLGQLKEEIRVVQRDIYDVLSSIEQKLQERRKVREKKTRLQHLLNVMSSLEKIEKILGADPKSHELEMFMEAGRSSPGHFLERIAGEFNQLQFHVTQTKGHPIIEDIRPRVALITSKLQENLEVSFQQGIRDTDEDLVLRCLRTYALIDKISNAEELFRHVFVAPYMSTIISDELYQGIGLINICTKILQFVASNCKLLLDLTSEGVNQETILEQKQHRIKGFDFLVNAVLPEICEAFELRLPFIFSPGNPDIFLERYRVMMSFLEKFELMCTSYESFQRVRGHPSYQTFIMKWSLPIYFQIRLQEIGGSLEEDFSKSVERVEEGAWKTNIFHGSWAAVTKCYDDKIYIDLLGGRFWKMFLQIVNRTSRYTLELIKDMGEGIQQSDSASTNEGEKSGRVKKLTLLHYDAENFISKVKSFFTETVETKLKLQSVTNTQDFQEALQEAFQGLVDSCASIEQILVQIISEDASTTLDSAKNVPRLYRRTNREPPSQPLPYVGEAFSALTAFTNNAGNDVNREKSMEILTNVVTNMINRYYNVVNELVTSIRKTEESLLRLKRQRKGGQGATTGATGSETSDESKIRKQLLLDCLEFGNQVNAINLVSGNFELYKQLKEILESEVKREPSV